MQRGSRRRGWKAGTGTAGQHRPVGPPWPPAPWPVRPPADVSLRMAPRRMAAPGDPSTGRARTVPAPGPVDSRRAERRTWSGRANGHLHEAPRALRPVHPGVPGLPEAATGAGHRPALRAGFDAFPRGEAEAHSVRGGALRRGREILAHNLGGRAGEYQTSQQPDGHPPASTPARPTPCRPRILTAGSAPGGSPPRGDRCFVRARRRRPPGTRGPARCGRSP